MLLGQTLSGRVQLASPPQSPGQPGGTWQAETPLPGAGLGAKLPGPYSLLSGWCWKLRMVGGLRKRLELLALIFRAVDLKGTTLGSVCLLCQAWRRLFLNLNGR